jgi:hypothetical protein
MVAVEKETVSQGKSGWPVPIGKYLILLLGKEDYGVPVPRVREIVKVIPFRSVPRAPSHIKGGVNLGGAVIPVVDTRLKFGMAALGYTDRTSLKLSVADSSGLVGQRGPGAGDGANHGYRCLQMVVV